MRAISCLYKSTFIFLGINLSASEEINLSPPSKEERVFKLDIPNVEYSSRFERIMNERLNHNLTNVLGSPYLSFLSSGNADTEYRDVIYNDVKRAINRGAIQMGRSYMFENFPLSHFLRDTFSGRVEQGTLANPLEKDEFILREQSIKEKLGLKAGVRVRTNPYVFTTLDQGSRSMHLRAYRDHGSLTFQQSLSPSWYFNTSVLAEEWKSSRVSYSISTQSHLFKGLFNVGVSFGDSPIPYIAWTKRF